MRPPTLARLTVSWARTTTAGVMRQHAAIIRLRRESSLIVVLPSNGSSKDDNERQTQALEHHEVPGGGRAHREQIARELTAIYQPRCNDQQYDQAWKDEWIGGTTASSPGLARDPLRPGAAPG